MIDFDEEDFSLQLLFKEQGGREMIRTRGSPCYSLLFKEVQGDDFGLLFLFKEEEENDKVY